MKTITCLFLFAPCLLFAQSNDVVVVNTADSPVNVVLPDDRAAILSAFQQGLGLGVVVVAGALGLSMLRTIPPDTEGDV
jgi:hypothetical protein